MCIISFELVALIKMKTYNNISVKEFREILRDLPITSLKGEKIDL
jgi:hypothetical protein